MTGDKDPWRFYHEGELAVQRRAGVGRGPGAMYRPAMPAGVREFLAQQQLAILASIGSDGRLWASLRSAAPGFVTAIDEETLRIGGYGHPEDLLGANLAAHDQLGVLVIDLATRSRLRANGTAILESDGAILLKTKQIYGNCQKYIQARTIVGTRAAATSIARRSDRLDARQQSRIAGADTFLSRPRIRERARMPPIAAACPVLSGSKARAGWFSRTTAATACSIRWATSSRILAPDFCFRISPPAMHCNSVAGRRCSGTTRGWRNFPARSGWSPSTSRKLSNSPKPLIFASVSPATRRTCPDKKVIISARADLSARAIGAPPVAEARSAQISWFSDVFTTAGESSRIGAALAVELIQGTW
jgi:predicted pyridoxine 5'-phosphate oxidase superfamily flavin-nucleotide-binding protein